MWNWRHARGKRAWIELLLFPFLLYFMFRWFEHKQVYHPSTSMDAAGSQLGRAWQDVWFAARDGTRLNGWFYPADATAKHSCFLGCQ